MKEMSASDCEKARKEKETKRYDFDVCLLAFLCTAALGRTDTFAYICHLATPCQSASPFTLITSVIDYYTISTMP